MMLLNTCFNVDFALDRKAFMILAEESFKKTGLHLDVSGFNLDTDSEFKTQYPDTSKLQEGELPSEEFYAGNLKEAFIVQIIRRCSNDEGTVSTYTERYVFGDFSDDHRKLHVTYEKTQPSAQQSFSMDAQPNADDRNTIEEMPRLMRLVFWHEFGGSDNGLPYDIKPQIVRKSDIDFAADIINGFIKYDSPIIYVSPDMESGDYNVNCDKLASELAGQAHVVVEGTPSTADAVSFELNNTDMQENHPLNGDVAVCMRDSKPVILSPATHKDDESYDFDNHVINAVRDMLLNVPVPENFDFMRLRQQHMFEGHADSSEIEGLFNEILGEKDHEIGQLNDEIAELKSKLASAQAKSDSLENGFVKYNSGENAISFESDEKELYTDERKDVILKILAKERDAMKDDANLSRSRKFDVINDVLEHNFPSQTDARLTECIKAAFDNGALTKEGIGCLQSAGFTVRKPGRASHYKVTLGGDERYMVTCSVTPSDNARGAKNSVSEFVNVLFR